MSPQDFNRRNFNRLAAAALGGVVAGAGMSAAAKDDEKKDATKKEMHSCRGLNSCKGNGADGKNECAGQGICATAAKITCAGHNACKNQGGCGETPGENACKGKGGCHVPLIDKSWKIARKRFEARMTKADKKFGAAGSAEEEVTRTTRILVERRRFLVKSPGCQPGGGATRDEDPGARVERETLKIPPKRG